MKRRHYLTLVIVLFGLSMWGLVSTLNDSLKRTIPVPQNTTDPETPGQAPVPVVTQDVVITSPSDGDTISSPVTIKGKAKGTWFFEGSFPVTVTTLDGTTLGMGIAKAGDNWMTEDYVPFTASIKFTAPTDNRSGYIVLKKDNPSGESQFDKSVVIKVQW